MRLPRRLKAFDEITESDWNDLVDCLAELTSPRVAPPLLVKDGVICLAEPFKVYRAFTTQMIPARSGQRMGSGTARLQLNNAAGVLGDVPGFNTRTVFNDNSNPIPAATLIKVYFGGGIWNVFNADVCAGDGSS